MHDGVFIGTHAKQQSERLLILAESHHIGDDPQGENRTAGVQATYTTENIIRKYFQQPTYQNYRCFDKIACSFGIDPNIPGAREAFWESVCFGNYIEVLCGVGNSIAKQIVSCPDTRKKYNDDLFRFVNDHEINKIFCFSRLVFNHLPSLSEKHDVREREAYSSAFCGTVGRQRDYVGKCKYLANEEHKATEIILRKDLTVFGMRHPSARGGFDSSHYVDILKKEYKHPIP